MKKKLNRVNIIKRAVPALASAIAISALYAQASFASTNNVAASDVRLGDTLTITAGYYEDDTVINIPTIDEVVNRKEINIDNLVELGAVPGIKTVTGKYYTGGANNNLGQGISSSKTQANVSLNASAASTLNLGLNETVTLPVGYYAYPVTINNGVKNIGVGSITGNESTGVQTYNINAGYYTQIKVDQTKAYNAGVTYADGRTNANSANYKAGYNAGVTAADARVNKSSQSYTQGVTDADARTNTNSANYKAGYNKGVSDADARVNTSSKSYTQGVTDADARTNTNSANYKAGYNAGRTQGQNDVKANPGNYLTATTTSKITGNSNTGVQTYSVTAGWYNKVQIDQTNAYNAGYSAGNTAGYNSGVAAADARANSDSANWKDGYSKGYSQGVTDADGRENTASYNYKCGYNKGVTDGKNSATTKTIKYVFTTSSTLNTNATVHFQKYDSTGHLVFDKTYAAHLTYGYSEISLKYEDDYIRFHYNWSLATQENSWLVLPTLNLKYNGGKQMLPQTLYGYYWSYSDSVNYTFEFPVLD